MGKKKAEEQNEDLYEDIYESDDDDYGDDEVPEGCAACGGPYPYCTTSCPLFDD